MNKYARIWNVYIPEDIRHRVVKAMPDELSLKRMVETAIRLMRLEGHKYDGPSL